MAEFKKPKKLPGFIKTPSGKASFGAFAKKMQGKKLTPTGKKPKKNAR